MITEELMEEISYSIPKSVLEMAYGRMYTSRIIYDVLHGKMIKDLNIGGGSTVDYPIRPQDIVGRQDDEVFIKVDIQSRVIVPVEIILYGQWAKHLHSNYQHPMYRDETSSVIRAMNSFMNSNGPELNIITDIERKDVNIFSVRAMGVELTSAIFRVRVFKKLEEFSFASKDKLGKFAVLLVKADVYNKLVISSEFGFNVRGVPNSALQNVINGYANALEEYNTMRESDIPRLVISEDKKINYEIAKLHIPRI